MSFLSLTRLGFEASLCPYAWLFTQVYRKDPYPEEMMRQNHVLKQPAAVHPGQRPDKEQGLSYEPQPPYTERQAGRELEQPAYRYDASSYPEQFARNYDHRLRYDDRLLTYEEQWPYYDDKQPYQPRPLDGQPPAEPTERGYFPRFEEPVPLSYEGRAHYDPLPRTSTLRHEEPPASAPAPGYDVHGRYRPDAQPYSTAGPKVPPEPKPYLDQYPRSYEPAPAQGFPSRAGPGHYEPLHSTTLAPPLGPSSQHKPEVPPTGSKPLPPPPAPAEEEEDPAMKPQSVLTRVKMFENKRSASMENRKDESHSTSFKVKR